MQRNNRNNNRRARRAQQRSANGSQMARMDLALQRQQLLALYELNGVQPPDVQDMDFPHLRRNKVYSFVRTFTATTLAASSTVDAPFAVNVTLASFPDSTEFTSLFDQYRFGPVRVIFTSIAAISTPSLSTKPVIHTVIDYDDSVNITTNIAFEYDSHQVNPCTSSFERVFQPKASIAAFGGSLFTSFAQNLPNQWFDVASPSIQFFGLKGIVPAQPTGANQSVYDVEIQAILQFKNTR